MAKLERTIGDEQINFLIKNLGRTFPSFKYLTTMLWGKPYYNNTCRIADMKRLAEVVEIEYREETWQVKIIKMK